METLVVAIQHRNQYCGSVTGNGLSDFNDSSYRGFRARGILPTPLMNMAVTVPEHAFSSISDVSSCSQMTQIGNSSWSICSVGNGSFELSQRSSPIRINLKRPAEQLTVGGDNDLSGLDRSLSFTELWAGPTYSVSPPPTSLPIPKFSRIAKETRAGMKSLPPSPTISRASSTSTSDLFVSVDSATETLRRILNIDVTDEVY